MSLLIQVTMFLLAHIPEVLDALADNCWKTVVELMHTSFTPTHAPVCSHRTGSPAVHPLSSRQSVALSTHYPFWHLKLHIALDTGHWIKELLQVPSLHLIVRLLDPSGRFALREQLYKGGQRSERATQLPSPHGTRTYFICCDNVMHLFIYVAAKGIIGQNFF